MVAKILIAFSKLWDKNLDPIQLISDLKEPEEAMEFRIQIGMDAFVDYGNNVLDALGPFIAGQQGWEPATDNYEGMRVQCDTSHGDGWFLLRLSLHDPVLPLNIESNTKGGISYIYKRLKTFFEDFPYLQLESIP